MLEVLTKHLNAEPQVCVVGKWVKSLKKEEQEAFNKIKEENKNIHLASLFEDLDKEVELPFRLTAFRSHFRGYCTCQR